MKEIPILYSTPMILAKLAGRKTVTRRPVKPQPAPCEQIAKDVLSPSGYSTISDAYGDVYMKHRYGQPGDILYARESFAETYSTGPSRKRTVWYKADDPVIPPNVHFKWKSPIFMRKGLARIYERVISVRPERLGDITEEDAVREGIEPVPSFDSGEGVYPGQKYKNYLPDGYREVTAIDSFKSLWQSIHGPESWNPDTWVWRLETEVLSTTGRPANI